MFGGRRRRHHRHPFRSKQCRCFEVLRKLVAEGKIQSLKPAMAEGRGALSLRHHTVSIFICSCVLFENISVHWEIMMQCSTHWVFVYWLPISSLRVHVAQHPLTFLTWTTFAISPGKSGLSKVIILWLSARVTSSIFFYKKNNVIINVPVNRTDSIEYQYSFTLWY